MIKWLIIVPPWLLFILCSLLNEGKSELIQRNKLLYLIIDGFRHDYVLNKSLELQGFSKFLEEGSRAEYLNPIFPSISYPAWTTLTTGLYAESHGIVGNRMYDPEEKDYFELFDNDSTGKRKWWTAEPIWATASKSDVNTAVIFFSRCDIEFSSTVPEHCEPFGPVDPGMELPTFERNANTAMEKLRSNADFVILYTDLIDHVGHYCGPDSEQTRREVRNIDFQIQLILEKLEEYRLKEKVNIVIASDHGMKNTAPGHINRVELEDYLPPDGIEIIIDSGAWSNVKVLPGNIDLVFSSLKRMPGVDVYKKEEIPDELHFRDHKFIFDILLKARADNFIMPSRSAAMTPPRRDNFTFHGHHGWWAKEEKDVRGIFFAKGPDFKSNHTVIPGIEMVDVYPLLAHLLRIQARPHNGSLERIKSILRHPELASEGKVCVPDKIYFPVLLVSLTYHAYIFSTGLTLLL